MATTAKWLLSVGIKPFDELYAELEKALQNVDRRVRSGPEGYLEGIELIRGSIEKLRIPGTKHIRKEAGEVEFFRNVWPPFYARLLLYTWLYKLQLRRSLVSADEWPALIGEEERRAAVFFRKHRSFWQYYRSGSSLIDNQFTRVYSRGRIFDPLALVMDPEFATLASYRAAQGLAYEEYMAYLQAELRIAADQPGDLGPETPAFEFEGTDAEGQEWLMELFASKLIRKKGGEHLNLSELNRWFKYNFGREFNKLFDKMNILRNRKIDPLRFLHKRMRATEKWMGEKSGRR
jgi:hypothetical protein